MIHPRLHCGVGIGVGLGYLKDAMTINPLNAARFIVTSESHGL